MEKLAPTSSSCSPCWGARAMPPEYEPARDSHEIGDPQSEHIRPTGCVAGRIIVCKRTMAPTRSWLSHERYPRLLLALLTTLSFALAIDPHDRAAWLLENSLLFGGVAVLVATHKVLPLSRISYTLIFVFLCMHAVGAHYTYSLVPYDAWLESLTGH